jgi:hypothetical protein
MKSAVVVLTCLLLCFAAQCSVVAQVDENREPVSVSVLEVAPAVDSDGGEVDRERVLAVKVALRQLAETKRFRLIEAMKLRRAANDDAVCEYLALKYQQEFDEIEAQAAAGDQFLKWIEWAIKNQDSIIKFVTTLVAGRSFQFINPLARGAANNALETIRLCCSQLRPGCSVCSFG